MLVRRKGKQKRLSHPDEPIVKEGGRKERDYWKIMELLPDNKHYTSYQRMQALQVYMITGSLMEVSKKTRIPYHTLAAWKKDAKWWKTSLQEMREQKDDEVDAKLTGIIDRTLDEMNERLDNGDEVLVKGVPHRKKVAFRDLSIAGIGVAYDKRALGRGLPTARTEHVSDKERLKKLADQFKKIANEKVVEGEVITDGTDD